jgi:hypothetical protein
MGGQNSLEQQKKKQKIGRKKMIGGYEELFPAIPGNQKAEQWVGD